MVEKSVPLAEMAVREPITYFKMNHQALVRKVSELPKGRTEVRMTN